MTRIYEIILPFLRDANYGVLPPDIPEDTTRAKLRPGQPLPSDVALTLDDAQPRRLIIRLAEYLEKAANRKPACGLAGIKVVRRTQLRKKYGVPRLRGEFSLT